MVGADSAAANGGGDQSSDLLSLHPRRGGANYLADGNRSAFCRSTAGGLVVA